MHFIYGRKHLTYINKVEIGFFITPQGMKKNYVLKLVIITIINYSR